MTPPRRPQTRALLLLTLFALALMAGAALLAWRLRPQPVFVAIPPELALDYPDSQFDTPDNAYYDYLSLQAVSYRLSKAEEVLAKQIPFDFWRTPPPEWTGSQVAHVRRWLPIYREGIDIVRRAADRPIYLVPRTAPFSYSSHTTSATMYAEQLQYDAELALRDGDQLRAADDYRICLRIAAQFPHYDTLGIRNEADRFQDTNLDALSDAFARHRFTNAKAVNRLIDGLLNADATRFPLAQTLRLEYAAARDWIAQIQDLQRLHARTTGSTPSPPLTLGSIRWSTPGALGDPLFNTPRPLRMVNEAFARKVRTLESDPLRALRDEIAEDRTGIPEFGDLLTFNAPIRTIVRKEALAVGRLRGVTLQTALLAYYLAHRAFPDTLDALVPKYLPTIPNDPFDGQPFRFRRDANGVTLWSIGPDLTDNHGSQPLTPAWRTLPNGDLVFSLSPPERVPGL